MITAGQIAGWVVGSAGLIAAVAALLKVGVEKRKIQAEVTHTGVDAARVLSETAMSLLQPSLEQIAFLRTELASARGEITQLRLEIAKLSGLMPGPV